jgi:hypothetical protein
MGLSIPYLYKLNCPRGEGSRSICEISDLSKPLSQLLKDVIKSKRETKVRCIETRIRLLPTVQMFAEGRWSKILFPFMFVGFRQAVVLAAV